MHACIHAARSLIRNNRIELSLASAHTCSGCIIARDPHVEDEDEDPFLSDDYRSFLYKCRQRQAMRAWGAQGACMHETDLRNGRGRHSARTVDEGVTVKRTSLSLSLSLSLFLSLSLARSLARARSLSVPLTLAQHSSTPMVEGAIEAVHKLVHQRFQDRVYLMCVAAPQVQARMLRWLSRYLKTVLTVTS
jgi:hypothetical protein